MEDQNEGSEDMKEEKKRNENRRMLLQLCLIQYLPLWCYRYGVQHGKEPIPECVE